ncbi:DUF2070 family protein [Archaeoglobus neptunius]|uniref:DUF2070 family protein n=1 Tax=Archaeoglobus neptunius TaxID=2798580 RepID=UPI00192858CF|nr:DUF2070 family protein [Archaeoglobus neptunius]
MRSFESLYYKLFSIPKPKVMVSLSVSIAILLSLIQFKILLLWLAIFFTSVLGIKLVKLKFELKRISFLAIFISVLTTPSLLLKGNVAATSFILFLTYYFCSEKKFPALSLGFVPYILVDASVQTAVLLAISLALTLIYLRILDITVGKVNIRDFVESFVLFWLTSDARYMETFLSRYSEDFEGRVRCLSLDGYRIISTDFHPGPFRNVGGARMVEILSNPNGVYLHSPTSHTRNPVNSDEVRKIAASLRCSDEILKPLKPFRVEGENFEVFCMPFDKLKIMFVSGKRRIDDFVMHSDNIVIDCHNAHENDYDPNMEDIEEISRLVKIAEEKGSDPVEEFKFAVVKMRAESESICGYVSAVLMNCDGESYAIVIFDSNNIDLVFRKHVEKLFRDIGYTAIVTSTDNHAKTGIRARQSYRPAGGCEEDWKIAEMLVNKCRNVSLSSGEWRYGESRVRIKVMGEKLLKDAEVAAQSRATFLIANFLGFAVLVYLLSVIGWWATLML